METREFSRFAAELLATSSQNYRLELTDGTVKLYFASLADQALADVVEGLHRHVRDEARGHVFPTVADILRHARVARQERSEAARARATARLIAYVDEGKSEPADPVERSLYQWRRVIAYVAAMLSRGFSVEPLDEETLKALNRCGAFDGDRPAEWATLARTGRIVPWAEKYARAFREEYVRTYGVELPAPKKPRGAWREGVR